MRNVTFSLRKSSSFICPRNLSLSLTRLQLRSFSAAGHKPANKLESLLLGLQTQSSLLPEVQKQLMSPGVNLFIPQSSAAQKNDSGDKLNLRLLGVAHEGRNYACVYTSEAILKSCTEKPFVVLPPRTLFAHCEMRNFVLNPNSGFWKLLPSEEVEMLLAREPALTEPLLPDLLRDYFKKEAPGVERAWLRDQKATVLVFVEVPLSVWENVSEGAKAAAVNLGKSVKFIRVENTADLEYFSTHAPFFIR